MIRYVIFSACLLFFSSAFGSFPTRLATQNEITASKADLIPGMTVNFNGYETDRKFYDPLARFLTSHDLDLLTCLTALENKSLNMPNGKLQAEVTVKVGETLSLTGPAKLLPQQKKNNTDEMESCLKAALTKGPHLIKVRPKKSKAEIIFSFDYSMPVEDAR